MIERIQWLGQSTFSLQGPPLVYIDPCGIARGAFLADVILVSQTGFPHFSPADIRKLTGPRTTVIGSAQVADAFGEVEIQVLRPWQSVSYGRMRLTAVPAMPSLEKREQAMGYLISLDYYDIYYAGACMPDAEALHLHPDIAILPIGNGKNGLSSVDQIVEVVKALRPRWVIPNYAGGGAQRHLDGRVFEAVVSDITKVVIPGEASWAVS